MSSTLRVDHLCISNFRAFNVLDIDLHPELTVLVARNGMGKTAVLDALAVALRYFVDSLVGSKTSHGFERTDIRRARAPNGSMVEQLPTQLQARGLIDGRPADWSRELASSQGRTTYVNAKVLQERSVVLRSRLQDFADRRRPDPPELPVVSYYGTGRLWSEGRLSAGKVKGARALDAPLAAYQDCLGATSGYANFAVWFEAVVREAQNEFAGGPATPHRPIA